MKISFFVLIFTCVACAIAVGQAKPKEVKISKKAVHCTASKTQRTSIFTTQKTVTNEDIVNHKIKLAVPSWQIVSADSTALLLSRSN
jgi:hypothetical protein